MIVVGFDPGLSGGLAAIEREGNLVDRMPVLPSGKGSGKVLDENKICDWITSFLVNDPKTHANTSVHAFIERASAMPKQGVTSVFTFGTGYGLIRGILVGLGIPYTIVSPKEWQGEMLSGMPKQDTKAASLIVAKRLFPSLAEQIGKHHGMSDALLLAEYGRRKLKA